VPKATKILLPTPYTAKQGSLTFWGEVMAWPTNVRACPRKSIVLVSGAISSGTIKLSPVKGTNERQRPAESAASERRTR
jgi:hypothetical protein